MDGVRKILFLALERGVKVYDRQILLLGHLLDVGNYTIVDYAVIDAPCVAICGYRQAEPDLGLGG